MKKKYDICIVGNGILGSTLAFYLAKKDPSLNVVVVGKKERVGSASMAAAAMFNVWCELSVGQFENKFLAKRFELTRKGGEKWGNFANEISDISQEKLNPHWGTYLIKTCKSTTIENKNFKYVKESLVKNNIVHQSVDVEDLKWLKGVPGSQATEALYVQNDGHIDSRKVLAVLEIALQKLKVELIDDIAVTLKPKKTGIFSINSDHEIITKNGENIVAKHIVMANGAYAQDLIDKVEELSCTIPRLLFGIGAGLDVEIPDWVKKYGGLGREILDLDCVVRTTDRGGACGVHLVPYGDGKYYAGASSLSSIEPDLKPKMHATHFLMHSLFHEINTTLFHASIQFRGVGFRPTSADTFPLLGQTNIEGIWLHNGTKRDGFTMSAHISEEMANNILGKKHEIPAEFTPCRKLISYKTKEEAIKDAEFMYMGADFQHGGIQAPYMIDKYLEMRRNEIIKIYEKRNIENFGIQPELIHLYENDEFYHKIKQSK